MFREFIILETVLAEYKQYSAILLDLLDGTTRDEFDRLGYSHGGIKNKIK